MVPAKELSSTSKCSKLVHCPMDCGNVPVHAYPQTEIYSRLVHRPIDSGRDPVMLSNLTSNRTKKVNSSKSLGCFCNIAIHIVANVNVRHFRGMHSIDAA
jgi:hypothetical protein